MGRRKRYSAEFKREALRRANRVANRRSSGAFIENPGNGKARADLYLGGFLR